MNNPGSILESSRSPSSAHVQVRSAHECLELLQRGEANRVFAGTEMNAHSSRSHAIVIVTVLKQRKRHARTSAEDSNNGGATPLGRCVRSLAALSIAAVSRRTLLTGAPSSLRRSMQHSPAHYHIQLHISTTGKLLSRSLPRRHAGRRRWAAFFWSTSPALSG